MSSIIQSLLAQSPINRFNSIWPDASIVWNNWKTIWQQPTQAIGQRPHRFRESIAEQEREADKIKNTIRTNLPSSLLMPFARSDVIALLTMQDKLANRAKEIAGLTLGRKLQIPSSLQGSFGNYFNESSKAAGTAHKAIEELDEVLESGFGDKEHKILTTIIEKLDQLEEECDQLQVGVRAELLALEPGLPPVDTMFLYRVMELVGDISDIAERIGNRLMILVSK